jgi:hypothetical protein
MDKQIILEKVIHALEMELVRQANANQQACSNTLDSIHRMASQRDTSGVEASFLSHGYAKQCEELTQQIRELKRFELSDFTGQEIDLGALIEVEVNEENDHYLLLPCGGGTEVEFDGAAITVITPAAPIGKALMGNVEAGFFSFRTGPEGIILNVY